MKRYKARVNEKVEHESMVGEYRVKYDVKVDDLARMCGCNQGQIVALQNGTMSPFCENNVTVRGLSYRKGDVRPYVDTMLFIFDATLAEVFPRYACDFERKEALWVDSEDCVELTEDLSDDGYMIESIDRKMTMDSFWSILESRVVPSINGLYAKLDKRRFNVLSKEFREDFTKSEIAKELGITYSRAYSLSNNSVVRVWRMLNLPEFEGLREALEDCC